MRLLETLRRIAVSDPRPAEVLVHVDGGDEETARAVRTTFADVHVLESDRRLGPGGGRNRLIKAACHPVVVSFDDDSYPLDTDFFVRVARLFDAFPDAAAIGAAVTHRGEPAEQARALVGPAASFIGCGAALRRDTFLAAGGYVPLPLAYGMEEVDLALRIYDRGGQILFSPWIRVFHDTDLAHHQCAEVTAATLANIALHAFLRYPSCYLPYGALQVANRILWSLRVGRRAGILRGLGAIPGTLWMHRNLRAPVSTATVARIRRLRQNPVPKLSPLPPDTSKSGATYA